MRLGMLQAAACQRQGRRCQSLDISEEILDHVARTVTGSGRELEGAFNQLLFRQSFEPQITIDRIDEILGHIYRSGEPKRVRIEDIQRIVARHYNVSKTELLSNRRTRTIVKPRQVAMYLSKVMTPRSLPEIGRRFGGRDHTTVLHAVRKIEDLSGVDNTLAQELELLRQADQRPGLSGRIGRRRGAAGHRAALSPESPRNRPRSRSRGLAFAGCFPVSLLRF